MEVKNESKQEKPEKPKSFVRVDKEKEKQEKPAFVQQGSSMETRRIVRFLETDIDGTMPLGKGLRRIRGINFMFSNALCLHTNMDPKKAVGSFSQEELKALENTIRNPPFPKWMLNRRKNMETGTDIHLLGTNQQFVIREDINAMRRMRAYKGIRHELGQPVRGQRTRSSFRTNKTLGVSKKKAQPAKAAAPAAAPAKK